MAKGKFKATGLARFILFMVVAAPLIFLGASYYNGEDGVQNLKNLIGMGDKTEEPARSEEPSTAPVETKATTPAPAPTPSPSQSRLEGQLEKAKDDLATREKRIDELYEENAELKKQLKDREQKLADVTDQLKKIKSAIGE